MCGRYVQTSPLDVLRSRFRIDSVAVPGGERGLGPRYNVAPGQAAPVVVRGEAPAVRELRTPRWGLVPAWADDEKIGYRMINARAETVAEKPAFRGALRSRRALVMADGFYEWRAAGGAAKGRSGKVPVFFRLKSREPFAFAGLWERWKAPDGAARDTFTILTTTPNALVATVHDRMPAILSRDAEETWLADAPPPKEALPGLLAPYPAEAMEVHDVSLRVNAPANDDPSLVEPWTAGAPKAVRADTRDLFDEPA